MKLLWTSFLCNSTTHCHWESGGSTSHSKQKNGQKEITILRVRIITLLFANCEVNSSYCDCKVVNHMKIAKQFFSKGKFYFSTLYLYFIHPLHTSIKWNITYTQNYTTKCKKCFVILKNLQKIIFVCGRVKASLHLVYLLQSEFQMIIWMLILCSINCKFLYFCVAYCNDKAIFVGFSLVYLDESLGFL